MTVIAFTSVTTQPLPLPPAVIRSGQTHVTSHPVEIAAADSFARTTTGMGAVTSGREMPRHRFEGRIIGQGKLRTATEEMLVAVDKEGYLYRQDEERYDPLGWLQANGSYRLLNGAIGNVFMDAPLVLSTPTLRGEFGAELLRTERRLAQQSSEGPLIQKRLAPLGLSGQGVSIQIIERAAPDYDGSIQTIDHAKAVPALITDPEWGYAPQATATLHMVRSTMPVELGQVKDDVASLDAFVACHVVDADLMAHLSSVAKQSNPPRIINMSNGLNYDAIGQQLMMLILERDEFEKYKRPGLAKLILGGEPSLKPSPQEEAAEWQKIITFVAQRYMANPAIQATLKQYGALTHQLAQRGVVLVVSMANSADSMPPQVVIPPGYGTNFLAMSDDVVAVAASNNNATPGILGDDWVTSFSSRGDGRWNPTVTATGMNVWMDRYYAGAGDNGVFSGTSASAPHTSGTIALMLQANPSLTVQQIKAILKQTATPVSHNVRLEGAGMLNPVAATLVAKSLAVPVQPTDQSILNLAQGSSSSLVAQIPSWNLSTQSPHP
ncbi:MAG: S8 family serine peptidase [Vampirovibrionales bacterium]|nr:S8 family serine peptidase [Vampirovibrionales bacterium]